LSSIVVLEDIEMIPVVELEPYSFCSDDRLIPARFCQDAPDDWYRYWLDSLADSGITGLTPVHGGSWNVPASQLTDPEQLRKVLEVTFQERVKAELPPDWGPLKGASPCAANPRMR
jgi:hypothetical protein